MYGRKETESAVKSGSIKTLLITEGYLAKARESEEFGKLEELMKLTEQLKGEVHLISTEHEAGKKLQGLGGIGGLLRYKVT